MICKSLGAVLFAGVCWSAAACLAAEQPPGHATQSHEKEDFWPQWRGPQRDNRSTDTGLLKRWPEGGPPLVWSVEGLGEGIASVSIADGRLFTVGHIEQHEYVTALDERSGTRIWAMPIGSTIGDVENNRLMRWLSQRTPTLDGDRLYAVRADAILVCLNCVDGRELWRKDFGRQFGTAANRWGFCDRPLVDGDKLICTPGGSEATIVALDKVTGEVRWQTLIGQGEPGAYGAMVVAEVAGIRQYVTFLDRGLVAVAAEDGRLLWRYDPISNGTANSHTPIVLKDELMVVNGYGAGLVRLKLSREAQDVSFQVVYRQSGGFDVFHDTAIVAGEHLYCSTRPGILTCLNAATGELVWRDRPANGQGMIAFTWAEDQLYVRNSKGSVTLVETGAAESVIKGKFSIPDHGESSGATFPVVTGGRLFLRDDNRLFCYDVREGAIPREAPARIVFTQPEASPRSAAQSGRPPKPIFVPTPHDVVAKMLELARLEKDDLVVDLGSGDGRIVIAAAKEYGCTAVGYEIDEELVGLSRARIAEGDLEGRATIEARDMYAADLGQVDVVMVYVYSSALEKMKSQFAKLKPGARIVSHYFEIPGVKAEKVVEVESQETGSTHRILLYTAPLVESE